MEWNGIVCMLYSYTYGQTTVRVVRDGSTSSQQGRASTEQPACKQT
jgi:hypothetical protein